MTLPANSYTRITSCSLAGLATQVATGTAFLERIVFNNVTTQFTIGTVANTSGATIGVGQITTAATGTVTPDKVYNVTVPNGIRIITTGKFTVLPDITVVWRQN